MRNLLKDAFRISPSHLARDFVKENQRQYHSHIPIVKTIDDETLVQVKIGIGGPLEIRVRQPPRPEANSPIIIFLKRGLPTATQNERCIKNLAIGANAIAVELNYTLSKHQDHGYPVPVHSVLAGYDWVRANLGCGHTRVKELGSTTKPSKIGVCGELVGGSLATMLALTECSFAHAELEPQGISALAVGNPILDWTALTWSHATQHFPRARIFRKVGRFPKAANNEALSADGFCEIREAYFSKAEKYFDPFASPLLFFRTPTSEIPNETSASTEHDLLNGGPERENPLQPPVKKRPSARKYPPNGSKLLLPWTIVEVGNDCVLKDQGVELVEVMRKSSRRSEVEGTADAQNVVRRDFEIVERRGLGLWDEEHTFEIGQWFGEVLRKP